jgi:hypothetical protein
MRSTLFMVCGLALAFWLIAGVHGRLGAALVEAHTAAAKAEAAEAACSALRSPPHPLPKAKEFKL